MPAQTQFQSQFLDGMSAGNIGQSSYGGGLPQSYTGLPESFQNYRGPQTFSTDQMDEIPPPSFAESRDMPPVDTVKASLPQHALTGQPMHEAKAQQSLYEPAPVPASMTQEGRPKDLILQCLTDSQGGADQVAPFQTPVIKERPIGLQPNMVDQKGDNKGGEIDAGVYDGEIVAGVREGQGTCTYKNGNMYEGEWRQNKRHGRGTLQYSSGAMYDGEWVEGERSGHGVMKYRDGASYEGQWLRDLKHGYGCFHFASGANYTGQWFEGKMHGQGTYTFADGQKFHGEFDRNIKSGFGTHVYTNGDQWDGVWVSDEPFGAGLYIFLDTDHKVESRFITAGEPPPMLGKSAAIPKLLRKEDKLRIVQDGENAGRKARELSKKAADKSAKARLLMHQVLEETTKMLGLSAAE